MIFAAGESSRMGRDKALLDFQGSTFLNRLIALFLPRVDPLVVVLGHNAETIRASIAVPAGYADADLRIVINSRHRLGMLSSFQAGIQALPSEAEAAMFTLVDHPAIRESTLDRLIDEFQAAGQLLAIPRYGDRRGHPVIASRKILEEVLQLPVDSSPKAVMRAHRAETHYVDVDDPGVLTDVDSPSEYEKLRLSDKS